ncbi:MAG: PAS domain S-box protein [Dehalococcoidia bacterium]
MKKYETPVRRKVLSGAVALAAVVTLIFGIDALREGLIVLAAVDLFVSAISAGIILAMRRRPDSVIPNWAFTVIMTSFFVYLFASGGHGGTGLLFMLLIPLATPLFLGWKGGAAVSLVGLAACAGVAVWGSVVSPLPGIPAGPLLARLSAIYLVALVLAGLYDSGMQRAHREESRAKEALQESEERYRALFGSSLYAVYVHGFEGNFLDANEAALKLLGYDRQDITRLNFASLMSEDQLPTALAALHEVVETGAQEDVVEFRLRCKDGSYVDAETISSLVYREGKPYAIQGVARDITAKKRVEEALRRSEERYRTILEETGDGYFESDLKGNFTFVNDAETRLLGYSKEEIIGANYRLLVPEENAREVFEAYNRMYRTGEPLRDFSSQVIRKDGSIGYAETSAFPIRNERGEIIGFRGVRRDVTERRQAEQALRESNARFDQLAQQSLTWIWEVDAQGLYTYASDVVEKVTGYRPEEIVGKMHFYDLHPEAGRMAFKAAAMQMFDRKEPIAELVNPIQTGHGDTVWVSTNGIPVLDRDGSLLGYRGSDADITRRKEAEEALRRSEEKHRTILEEMEDSYFEVDLGGHITFVNSSTCRDLGYSKNELIGMSYKHFTAEEDIESVYQMFNEVYRAGTPNRGFSWKTVRKDGDYGYAETSVSPLRNDEGEIIGFRGVGRDVGERKRAEEALRAQTAYFQQLFDSSPDAIVMMDTDDRVLRVNRGFEALFGYGAEEVTGRSLDGFIIPEDLLEESSISSQTVRHGGVVRKETERRRKDGSLIDVSVVGYPIEIDGRFVGMYVTYTDITERKQQAEQLIMADRLASVGELAAGMAHELNNPLTSVMGFSQLLMEKDIPEDMRDDLELIHNEARRASEVTKNLLTFARKHAPVKQPSQLNSIIEDVLRLRAYEHRVSNIRVKRQLARSLPEIKADHFQMQQVFLNIIINAEHIMAEANKGGTLTIATRKRSGRIVASISDDGPGISREHLSQIFNPFFTTKEPGKGTGLGLSICYGIVNEHGGRIYARSEAGRGTTFFVELPVNGVH